MGCNMVNAAAMLSWFVSTTAKCISSAPLPIQVLGPVSSTHSFINEQGRRILLHDGYRKAAHLFDLFAVQLDLGVVWIDRGFKSAYHHYDPDRGTGMWLWPSAAEKCSEFFNRAVKLWHEKKHARAMFFLGAALHLVQDVCVPHHASCKIFDGHMDFEDWAEQRKDNYRVERGGKYGQSVKPEEWIAENARLAKDCFPLVSAYSAQGYHRATEVLLARAQQTSAGFLLLFYRAVNAPRNKVLLQTRIPRRPEGCRPKPVSTLLKSPRVGKRPAS